MDLCLNYWSAICYALPQIEDEQEISTDLELIGSPKNYIVCSRIHGLPKYMKSLGMNVA